MDLFKTKEEIKSEYECYSEEVKCFSKIKDLINMKSRKMPMEQLIDLVWKNVVDIYKAKFSGYYLIDKAEERLIKDEIILSLFSICAHNKSAGVSLNEWHETCKNSDKRSSDKSYSNAWNKWLQNNIVLIEPFDCGKLDDISYNKCKILLRDIASSDDKSADNHKFTNYILSFTYMLLWKGKMGSDNNLDINEKLNNNQYFHAGYEFHFPCKQLIYDSIKYWESCPYNSKYNYGMELSSYNEFRKSVLKRSKSVTPSSAYDFLNFYMVDELFYISYLSNVIKIINKNFIINSNNENIEQMNAIFLRNIKQIQLGYSQFVRNKIINKYLINELYSNFKEEQGQLNGFIVPILSNVFSYYIFYLFEQSGKTEDISDETIYSSVYEYCKSYIELNEAVYKEYFAYYLNESDKEVYLKDECIPLEINITRCLFYPYDFSQNNYEIQSIVGINSIEIFKSDYYLSFPRNYLYTEYLKMRKDTLNESVYKEAIVPDYYHIEYNDYLYSVPNKYIGTTVIIRIYKENIVIYNNENKLITKHTIAKDRVNPFVTYESHVSKDIKYIPLYAKNLINQAKDIGSNVKDIFIKILNSKSESKFRTCMQFLKLSKQLKDNKKFNDACSRIKLKKEISLELIEAELKCNLM